MANLTPMKAIRKKCLDCCSGQHAEVRACTIKNCPLWGYRMGIDPKVNNLPPKRVKSENYPRSYRFFDTERES